jgi:peptidoglycan/xylan/chitin deacetylase (PgdA/CDA1 family)
MLVKFKHTIFIIGLLLFSGFVSSAVILQYHHVSDDTPRITSISPKLFEQHLSYIKEQGYQVWDLPKLVRYLKSKKDIPRNVTVITFDDAHRSIYQTAYPILKEYNWPFTVFVASDPVDQGLKSFMSWQQLKELSEHGGTSANHSLSQPHLGRKNTGESESDWRRRIGQELQGAEDRLIKELGSSPKLLAYPYGEFTGEIQIMVADMGLAAFGQHSGAVDFRYDLTSLPRFPMNDNFGAMAQFKIKLASLPLLYKKITPARHLLTNDETLKEGMKIEFYPEKIQTKQLACYYANHGKIKVEVSQDEQRILVTTEPLPALLPGRSRINCTAPSSEVVNSGRYYWFSHYWMQTLPSGEWYSEP